MGGPYRKKANHRHTGDTHLQRRWRLRNRGKDLDQIDVDLKNSPEKLLNQDIDFDKPGFAQNYCIHCAKYFINEQAMKDHFKTKVHKRRLKALEDAPYSIEEAERAAGHGSYVPHKKRKMETQPEKGSNQKIVIEEVDELPRKKAKRAQKMDTDVDVEVGKNTPMTTT